MCVPTKYRHSLTNVQALSIFCPIFVQVLSLSKMDKYWRNSKTILSTMSRYFGNVGLKGSREQGQKQAGTVGGHNFRWNLYTK